MPLPDSCNSADNFSATSLAFALLLQAVAGFGLGDAFGLQALGPRLAFALGLAFALPFAFALGLAFALAALRLGAAFGVGAGDAGSSDSSANPCLDDGGASDSEFDSDDESESGSCLSASFFSVVGFSAAAKSSLVRSSFPVFNFTSGSFTAPAPSSSLETSIAVAMVFGSGGHGPAGCPSAGSSSWLDKMSMTKSHTPSTSTGLTFGSVDSDLADASLVPSGFGWLPSAAITCLSGCDLEIASLLPRSGVALALASVAAVLLDCDGAPVVGTAGTWLAVASSLLPLGGLASAGVAAVLLGCGVVGAAGAVRASSLPSGSAAVLLGSDGGAPVTGGAARPAPSLLPLGVFTSAAVAVAGALLGCDGAGAPVVGTGAGLALASSLLPLGGLASAGVAARAPSLPSGGPAAVLLGSDGAPVTAWTAGRHHLCCHWTDWH